MDEDGLAYLRTIADLSSYKHLYFCDAMEKCYIKQILYSPHLEQIFKKFCHLEPQEVARIEARIAKGEKKKYEKLLK